MSGLVRFGVSLDKGLSEKFDALIGRKGYKNRSEAIRDLIVESSPELEKYRITIGYDDGKWAGSDQWPFARNDLDVTNSWGGGSYEYHTHMDDMTRLNEESLQIGARIIGSYIISETC